MALKRRSRGPTGPRLALTLVLLWLVGMNLRTVILGVPPTLPARFGWQVALAAWAAPAAVVLAFWLIVTPASEGAGATAGAWLPDWRSGRMLRVGLLMGGASLVYFGMNSWIPDTLDARHAHG